ncbi:hypothetical protein E2562_008600 [Oryza meyeriana var. granulata]|uniref:Uncharacterized protein n=1 Tax=Oryza meyeriana var. granulata TaxID=110450 RepID=A0A6G1C492_9ORYZ|nr:hypothetical protein E2562_008600 [Oryza meyeriana var. granulata]
MAEIPEESAATIQVRRFKVFPFSYPPGPCFFTAILTSATRRRNRSTLRDAHPRVGDSSCRRKDAAQPPDIKNWFSSYEYESPEVPELVAGQGGNSGSETQDPLEVGVAEHSLLDQTTHDGDGDSALRGNRCGQQHEHEVSARTDLIPAGRSTVERGAKRKQSLRSLFGDDFLDNLGETSETESRAVLSVQRNEAEALPDCNAMGLPDDIQGGQEGAIQHGKLPVDCNGIDVADTQEGSQGAQETEHSRLPICDGMSSSQTEKNTPKDGNEHRKLSVDCTSASMGHTESRFEEDGMQNSIPPISCNGITIPDTEENSPGEEICHGNPAMCHKEHEETVATDGFVAIRRKEKPEQALKTTKILQPPMRREKATLHKNRGIMEQKVIVQGRNGRSPLADMTNVSEVAAAPSTEICGKWKCPRKGKPYVGPPLKQLRLEQWNERYFQNDRETGGVDRDCHSLSRRERGVFVVDERRCRRRSLSVRDPPAIVAFPSVVELSAFQDGVPLAHGESMELDVPRWCVHLLLPFRRRCSLSHLAL